MLRNSTLDDTSPLILYSSGWSTQSPSDPQLRSFLGSTYHATQTNGSSANITFNGTAVYVYGTMGPSHSKFRIQFDNLVYITSAFATQTLFQQPLFGWTFNNSGPHFVSFQALYNEQGNATQWLDLDYILIAADDGTPSSSLGNPISPPWGSPTATPSVPPTESSRPSPSGDSRTSKVLSVIFGTIIGLALGLLLSRLAYKRYYKWHRKREHNFRRGLPHGLGHAFIPSLPDQVVTPTTADPTTPATPFTDMNMKEQPHSDIPLPIRPTFSPNAEIATVTDVDAGSESPSSIRVIYSSGPPASLSNLSGLTSAAHTASTSTPLLRLIPNRPLPPTPCSEDGRAGSTSSATIVDPRSIPVRPKRPSENLLDWMGGAKPWDITEERRKRARRRKDEDSLRTDFLQI